jgi:rod shape-determining protein MreB and related proteins
VLVAEDPLTCVARGGGRFLETASEQALEVLSHE